MIKTYFSIINILLLTVAIYLGVTAFYKIAETRMTQFQHTDVNTQNIVKPDHKRQRPLSNYAIIAERNLFHTEPGKVPESKQQVDLDRLKQTDLNLKLWGTVIGGQGKDRAVIEDTKKRKQNLYSNGDAVPGATLKLILREKVVLSVNGKDEILEMEKLQSGRFSKRSASGLPSKTSTKSSPARAYKVKLKRSQIEDAMANMNDLMNQIKIRPYIQNGEPDGLILSGIKPNSLFRKMGLRNGDIIKGVEGEKIQSMDDAINFYSKLKSADSAALQIKRRGQLRDIIYNIEN
jgi:general secretion pathway protein C